MYLPMPPWSQWRSPMDILLKLIPFIRRCDPADLRHWGGSFVPGTTLSRWVSISNVAKRMTTLDMTWKCEVNRKDEIGVLAASLNEMSQRFERYDGQLEGGKLAVEERY